MSRKFDDMEFEDDVAAFTLRHNESKTAGGLLAGVTYKIDDLMLLVLAFLRRKREREA